MSTLLTMQTNKNVSNNKRLTHYLTLFKLKPIFSNHFSNKGKIRALLNFNFTIKLLKLITIAQNQPEYIESNYIKGNIPAEKQSSTTFFWEEIF